MVQQRDHDEVPTLTKDADQPPATALLAGAPGTGGQVAAGTVASASPPTDSSHQVAIAMANHRRSARAGSSMRVYCHCQPPRLIRLKPCSIQVRNPYQQAWAACGDTS